MHSPEKGVVLPHLLSREAETIALHVKPLVGCQAGAHAQEHAHAQQVVVVHLPWPAQHWPWKSTLCCRIA